MESHFSLRALIVSACLVALFEVIFAHYLVPGLPDTASFAEFFWGNILFLLACAFIGLLAVLFKLPSLGPESILSQLLFRLLRKGGLLEPTHDRYAFRLPLDTYDVQTDTSENVKVYRPYIIRYSFFKAKPRIFDYIDVSGRIPFVLITWAGIVFLCIPFTILAVTGHSVLAFLVFVIAATWFSMPFAILALLPFPWFYSGYFIVTDDTIENLQTHQFFPIKDVREVRVEIVENLKSFLSLTTKYYQVVIVAGSNRYPILSVTAHTLLLTDHFDLRETADNLSKSINHILSRQGRESDNSS